MSERDEITIPTTIEEVEQAMSEMGELSFDDLPQRLKDFPEMMIELWSRARETLQQDFGDTDPILVDRKFLEAILATFGRQWANRRLAARDLEIAATIDAVEADEVEILDLRMDTRWVCTME